MSQPAMYCDEHLQTILRALSSEPRENIEYAASMIISGKKLYNRTLADLPDEHNQRLTALAVGIELARITTAKR